MIKAGQAKRFETFATAETKKSATDFLTETDLAVEVMIEAAISEKYPQHKLWVQDRGQTESLPDDLVQSVSEKKARMARWFWTMSGPGSLIRSTVSVYSRDEMVSWD